MEENPLIPVLAVCGVLSFEFRDFYLEGLHEDGTTSHSRGDPDMGAGLKNRAGSMGG